MNSASLSSLAGRYDNPIPNRFLASIDFLKIPAQFSVEVYGLQSLGNWILQFIELDIEYLQTLR